jgi:hypothetical protein
VEQYFFYRKHKEHRDTHTWLHIRAKDVLQSHPDISCITSIKSDNASHTSREQERKRSPHNTAT